MENKELNLCEILKDCPKGTRLYSTTLGTVEFEEVYHPNIDVFPIKVKISHNGGFASFTSDGKVSSIIDAECCLFPSKDNRDWSAFKTKKERFDHNTLKPFDKVLVRDNNEQNWRCDFFSFIHATKPRIICRCVTDIWKYTIPFNDETAHLVGTTEEAPEYYKWWE